MFRALFLFAAVFSAIAMAQNTDDTNASCIKRLEVPTYPRLGLLGRQTGTVTVITTLDAEAKTQKVETSSDTRNIALFTIILNAALKKSDFRKECAGQSVRIVFHFEIVGLETQNPKTSVAYGYPNEFWVVSEPSVPIIN